MSGVIVHNGIYGKKVKKTMQMLLVILRGFPKNISALVKLVGVLFDDLWTKVTMFHIKRLSRK